MLIPLAPPPSRDPRPFLQLLHVPPGRTIQTLCLTQQLLPFNLHYIERRTLPCRWPLRSCDHCAKGSSTRWGAYAAVWCLGSNKPNLLLVTQGAYENSPELQARDGQLGGVLMELQRLGKTRNSPLQVKIVERTGPWLRTGKAPEVNLVAALSRMWSLPEMAISVGSSTPSPIDNSATEQ